MLAISVRAARATLPLALLCLVLGGCGGASEPPSRTPAQAEPEPTPVRPKVAKPRMQLESELGTVDRAKVDDAFARLQGKLADCMGQGASRVEFLSGHVQLTIRIGANGATRWVHLADTTLGDRLTERCMLDEVRAMRWPPPEQGEGQVEKSFDFDVAPGVRDAIAWDAERVSKPVRAARGKLAHCLQASRGGKYKLTAYVSGGGSVMAVGVAPPDERSEANVDCLVDALKGVKMPDPGSWPAKVSFEVP